MSRAMRFFKDIVFFCYLILRVVKDRSYINSLKYVKQDKPISVFGNGPSLKNVIEKYLKDNSLRGKTDIMVLNFFAEQPCFKLFMPKHYCLADPVFFRSQSEISERVNQFWDILRNETDWCMNLYVPRHFEKWAKQQIDGHKFIKIISVNFTEYKGFESLRNFFYKKNYCTPIIQTVINMAIYVAINIGYRTIYLHGVEHSFFDGICVNSDNQLCVVDKHFYDKTKPVKNVIFNDKGQPMKVSEYLSAITKMFLSHDLLSEYAKKMGVSIYNCTQGSMIDSYSRINMNDVI